MNSCQPFHGEAARPNDQAQRVQGSEFRQPVTGFTTAVTIFTPMITRLFVFLTTFHLLDIGLQDSLPKAENLKPQPLSCKFRLGLPGDYYARSE